MTKLLKISKGLDLKIEGALPKSPEVVDLTTYEAAVTPDDFEGFTPKTMVKEGDTVKEGAPLLHDKRDDRIKVCSPISGRVKAIVRGERRKIIRIEIEADGDDSRAMVNVGFAGDEEKTRQALMQSGLWVFFRQLPYDIVPDPAKKPRDIFVTTFDSAPLAGDYAALPGVTGENISRGLDVLSHLTEGKIYLTVRDQKAYSLAKNDRLEIVVAEGPHPAGLPSIQVGNIRPVNKGETVWLTDIVTVAKVGELADKGYYTHETLVALTGPEVKNPHYVRTIEGADVRPILRDSLKEGHGHVRIISGNVLTGYKIEPNGFLRYPYRQLTVISEGDDRDEFMGWASMSPSKLSASRSFPFSRLRTMFSPDARLNGGRRAMIMSEVYDKTIPLDIMPEYLIKAILARNIERMEQLGIYEVSPADFALAEFTDPSKLELQKIVREGLDYLRKETE